MAVDRVGGGGSSSVVGTHREESGWSRADGRAGGVDRAWHPGALLPRGALALSSCSLVEVVDPAVLEAESPVPPETDAPPEAPDTWVDEELREVGALTVSQPAGGAGGMATCRLETAREAVVRPGGGLPPDFEPGVPATLPVGSTLRLEVRGPGREETTRCEVHRLDASTLRLTAMPVRPVVEEPFAGLLVEELARDVGGTHTVERALGWTADLDVDQPVALRHYREFLALGEVPVTHRAGGVLRSGRVAAFKDSCAPGVELRFLRDFAWLDGGRVESLQRVVEYDDGGVEVRSHARFGEGRQLFSTILVDTAGQQVRGDHSLVLSHLPRDAGVALAALFGGRYEGAGACHARVRLTDEEAMRWRDLARAQVCRQTAMSVGRFETEARTQDMAAWKGSPQLISLALSRTPAEVADAVARFHATAEGLVSCLVRLGAGLGAALTGTLRVVSASEG